jgi:Bacteriophage head to tail connecting protein
MPSWQELEKIHSEMRQERALEERMWRELARYLRPDQQNMEVSSRTDRDWDVAFDSTPLYANDDFVGGMFSNATNPATRWFELVIDDTDLMKYGPVKQYLWDRASIHYATLNPGISDFYLNVPPWFADMGAFGTGWLSQEEVLAVMRIIERAIPINEMFKGVNAAGETNRIHREFMLTGRQAEDQWKGRAPDMRPEERAKFIHAVYQNPEYVPGRLGRFGFPWLSSYVSPDKRDFEINGGFYELPYHEIQWARRSGKAWATGPGHDALPDMRSNDEWSRLSQVAMQFEAEPMLLVANEDVLVAEEIRPHGLVYGGMTKDGKRQVEVLKRGENLQYPLAEREQLRNAIRNAFKFGLWQVLKNRPQMTATEFLGFKEEDLKLLAPHLMPLQKGLSGFVTRRDGILARQGAFNVLPVPQELVGHRIRIKFESPFEKAQRAETARGTLQWWTSLAGLAQTTGDPSILDVVNSDQAALLLHESMVADPSVRRSEIQIEQIRQGRAQVQQQSAELQAGVAQAGMAADLAHAEQAKTLAAGRKPLALPAPGGAG